MVFIRSFVFPLFLVLLVQCSTTRPTSWRRVTNDLSEYKLMTEYILCKNYHESFDRSLIFDFGSLPDDDSLLYEFMRRKNISGIYCQGRIPGLTTKGEEELFRGCNPGYSGDSLIEFHFFYVPVFGKRRELVFDFSSDAEANNKEGWARKDKILEEGIYYREY